MRPLVCKLCFNFFLLLSSSVALQALKRKKRYEQQLEQLQGTLTTIETQREALENANTNSAVLDTMKGASDALKKSHKDMNIDNVHEMMDDIAEQNDIANEISNAISTGIIGQTVDDDELARELEELEQEGLDAELLKVDPTPNKLPDVPSTDLPSASKEKKKGTRHTCLRVSMMSINICVNF
jgi:charged multivesicular body protein 4A/B